MFSLSDDELSAINIKVVGVGGAGCNAVNTMIESGLEPRGICGGEYGLTGTWTFDGLVQNSIGS